MIFWLIVVGACISFLFVRNKYGHDLIFIFKMISVIMLYILILGFGKSWINRVTNVKLEQARLNVETNIVILNGMTPDKNIFGEFMLTAFLLKHDIDVYNEYLSNSGKNYKYYRNPFLIHWSRGVNTSEHYFYTNEILLKRLNK